MHKRDTKPRHKAAFIAEVDAAGMEYGSCTRSKIGDEPWHVIITLHVWRYSKKRYMHVTTGCTAPRRRRVFTGMLCFTVKYLNWREVRNKFAYALPKWRKMCPRAFPKAGRP